MITFDRGGQWVPLRKPKNTSCDSTARSKDEVGLGPVPMGAAAGPSVVPCLGAAKGMLRDEGIQPTAPSRDAEGVRLAMHGVWGTLWDVDHSMGLWFTPWGCESHYGVVDHSMGLWLTPRAVDRTMGLWIALWGCG